MKSTRIFALLFLAAGAWAEDKFTKAQLEARFWYDLGSAEIDVSAYPKDQQDRYAVFAKACSQCHTLARAVNSPLVKKADFERFIQRMHLRTKVRPAAKLTKDEAKTVVEFLAYDAQARKVEGKKAFDAKAKELKSLFDEVQKERSRLQLEEGKKKAKPAPPYTGDK